MELIIILKRFQNKYRKNQILFSIFLFLSILLLILLLIVGFFINRWILLLLVPTLVIVIYKSNFFLSLISLSRKIEVYFPEIKDKLLPVVELCQRFKFKGTQTKEGYSPELIDAAIEQVTKKVKILTLEKIINYRKTRYSFLILLVLVLAFCSIRLFSKDNFHLGWNLAFNRKRVLINLNISPGNIFVNKDSIVKISYSIDSPVKTLRTILYAKNMKFSNQEVLIKADREFDYFLSVRSILGVPILRSPNYHIGLNRLIEITNLNFTYHYPSYTHFASNQSRSSDIKAIKGTYVEFNGSASMPLTSAMRIGSEVKIETLSVNNDEFKGSFTITREDSFEIVLNGENHRQGKSQRFYITPSTDEFPFVRIFLPGQDIDVPVNMQVLIGMYGLDDFGLTRFDLYYTNPTTGETVKTLLKSVFNKPEDTLLYLWDLTKLNLLPGEVINYYGVVHDNDVIAGYKTARSETYSVRFPTLSEIYDQATETNQTTQERLAPIAETQNQLQKELDKISEHIQQYRSMDWEEKSKVKELLAKQEELMSEINSIQQEINNTISNMYSGLMLDKETLDRMREISDVLSQILPEEMKQRLEELQKQLQEKTPDITKALENFKMSSEEMKEALKRALELLKNIQKQEQLNNLARKAEEIYKQQTELNTRMEGEKLSKLISPQDKIGNEIKDLQDEIQKMSTSFEDSMVQAELAKITQELNQMKISNQVSNVSKNLGQENRSESKKSASDLLKDLQKLKDQLRNLADQFKKDQSDMLTDKLLKIANDLNDVSVEQEKISPNNENKQALSQFVIRQKKMSDATTLIAETLAAWSEKSLYVSPNWTKEIVKAVSAMDQAAQVLEDATHSNIDLTSVQVIQDNAMYQVNMVALQILYLALQGQKAGGMAGGLESLLQALSQMTADQMSLGQEMGGMIPIPMPGGLSPEQMSQLGRLLSMQSQLRSQLEQLMQEMNLGKYGQLPGMTGSMEGAAEEMKQIEKDLTEQMVNRQTIERQEQVINRLLDAQRSIRQKEYTEKREREIGKEYPNRPRIILDKNLGETKKQLREELLRALREGYPKEYEFMIKNYFEELIKE